MDGLIPKNHGSIGGLGGGFLNVFGMFIPNLGEDEPILTHIFQLGNWVGSTTN